MAIATAITSTVLAALLIVAALRKLSHRREVVRSYRRVGVPEHRLNHLALILLAGAAGLLAGIAWPPLGLVAAVGVVAYFLLAVAAHVRFDDREHLATPAAIELLAIATLVLRSATL